MAPCRRGVEPLLAALLGPCRSNLRLSHIRCRSARQSALAPSAETVANAVASAQLSLIVPTAECASAYGVAQQPCELGGAAGGVARVYIVFRWWRCRWFDGTTQCACLSGCARWRAFQPVPPGQIGPVARWPLLGSRSLRQDVHVVTLSLSTQRYSARVRDRSDGAQHGPKRISQSRRLQAMICLLSPFSWAGSQPPRLKARGGRALIATDRPTGSSECLRRRPSCWRPRASSTALSRWTKVDPLRKHWP